MSVLVPILPVEFGLLLQLRMTSDPMPNEIELHVDIIDDWLDKTAVELGFVNWIDAYHKIP